MHLEDALRQFDITETNLARLEDIWTRITQLRAAREDGPEHRRLLTAYREITDALPPIDGFRIESQPMRLDEIELGRFEAHEVGEASVFVDMERAIEAPGDEIEEYRYRFGRARRELVRPRVRELINEVERLLDGLVRHHERGSKSVEADGDWAVLNQALSEIERLAGDQVQRRGRWGDLARHRHFALGVDLHDIAEFDWPSVRADLEAALYTTLDPMPGGSSDLTELARTSQEGPVATRLAWERLDDEDFERLVYNLLDGAAEYENPRWDTRTRASDGSRDLEVDHVVTDSLSGSRRERVIVQCKHWTTRSVNPDDVLRAVSDVRTHWEPPSVDLLIIVTSGRFTSNAVKTIQAHNARGERPRIDWWAESRLESLLATRTRLVMDLDLRDRL